MKHSLQDAKRARMSPSGIEFSITVDNTSFPIVAFRPVRANDRLWLAYNEQVLEPVIKYVRAAAFKEELITHHIHFSKGDDLYHKGIRARSNDKKPFIVAKKSKDGKMRYRSAASLHDAVEVLEDNFVEEAGRAGCEPSSDAKDSAGCEPSSDANDSAGTEPSSDDDALAFVQDPAGANCSAPSAPSA